MARKMLYNISKEEILTHFSKEEFSHV